jgi:hypothetical protein
MARRFARLFSGSFDQTLREEVALLHHRVQKGPDFGDEPRSLRRDQEARAPLDPEAIGPSRDPSSLALVEKDQAGVEPVRGRDDGGFSRAVPSDN